MAEFAALHALARALGIATRYTDGLNQPVSVGPETLVRVARALGAQLHGPQDAANALHAHENAEKARLLPPVIVAWDGQLPAGTLPVDGSVWGELKLQDGEVLKLEQGGGAIGLTRRLPAGYHRLTLEAHGRREEATVISAPVHAWRRPGQHRSWGVGTHLAALRYARSRSVGDLKDLGSVCDWVRDRGGDLVVVLPLLPTFNSQHPEPSPYSPVSRLFWSELMLDLGPDHRPTSAPMMIDVQLADREVRAALAHRPLPSREEISPELEHYARFRGAQARLGRNWRDWPTAARVGTLTPDQIDPDEERFHLIAQVELRRQLGAFREVQERVGMRVGLDLAVGVHPDGYDPWSRQHLFGEGISVGAPPDQGFPSGQDWGFSPVLPEASRREGHYYIAGSIGHQAGLAGVLRVDHIMAWTRLYWIPHGMNLDQGTYVKYPAEELFAVLALESQRHRCEVVGENLGNVPPEIGDALPRHRIWGMSLAIFNASGGPDVCAPTAEDMALVGTHDTPTFLGWLKGNDIDDRVRYHLLKPAGAPAARKERAQAIMWLAATLGCKPDNPAEFLARVLVWLGQSPSPLVVPWLEDFWLEEVGVNLPGTPSSVRPNWQRPLRALLDDLLADPAVDRFARLVEQARRHPPAHP